MKSYHFLTCFVMFPKEIEDGARFAEYIGPQLIKQGTVSELMKLIRATEVSRASVKYVGEKKAGGQSRGSQGREEETERRPRGFPFMRKDYWKTRLEDREYDVIRFRNCYGADVPEMEVEWKGVKKIVRKGEPQYAIQLGKVLSVKRWQGKR